VRARTTRNGRVFTVGGMSKFSLGCRRLGVSALAVLLVPLVFSPPARAIQRVELSTVGQACPTSAPCLNVRSNVVRSGASYQFQVVAPGASTVPRAFRVVTQALDGSTGTVAHPFAARLGIDTPAVDDIVVVPAGNQALTRTVTTMTMPPSAADRPFELRLVDIGTGNVLDTEVITIVANIQVPGLGFVDGDGAIQPFLLAEVAEGETVSASLRLDPSAPGPVDVIVEPFVEVQVFLRSQVATGNDDLVIGSEAQGRLFPGQTLNIEFTGVIDTLDEGVESFDFAVYARLADPDRPFEAPPLDGDGVGPFRFPTAFASLSVPANGGDQFVISDATVTEGEGDTTVEISRIGSRADTVTVPLTYEDGTGSWGNDIRAIDLPVSVTFEPGEETESVDIPILDDAVFEDVETLQMRLGQPSRGRVRDGSSTITINDVPDFPAVRFDPNRPVSVSENVGSVRYELTLGAAAAIDLAFRVATSESGLADANDFTPMSRTIVIPAGETVSEPFDIAINPVPVSPELPAEEFTVEASAIGGPFDESLLAAAVVTITSERGAPRIRVVGPRDPVTQRVVRRVNEGNVGVERAVFTIELIDGIPNAPYTVDVAITGIGDDSIARVNNGDARTTVESITLVRTVAADGTLGPNPTIELPVTFNNDDIAMGDLTALVAFFNVAQEGPDDLIEITFVDDDRVTPPGDLTGDILRDGINSWWDTWDDFAPAFDLGNIEWVPSNDPDAPQSSPPVLPANVDDRFGLDEGLAGIARPLFDPAADAIEDLLADMAANGCPADFVIGGVGGVSAPSNVGDLIQVTCTRTLGELLGRDAGDTLNGATPGVLQALAANLGLDATLTWTADAQVRITAGVDASGFYVLGTSGVRLDVDGSGAVTSTGDVLGVQNTSLTGTADADIAIVVRASTPTTRLRGAAIAASLVDPTPVLSGTASIDLTGTVDTTTVTWNGDWTLAEATESRTRLTTAQTIEIVQDLPGFAVGGVAAPTTVTLTGTLTERNGEQGWALSGSAVPAAGLTIGDVTVTELSGRGFVSETTRDITIDVGVRIGTGDTATDAQASLRIVDDGWTVSGGVSVPSIDVAPVRVTQATITFSGGSTSAGTTFGVGFSAASAVLLDADGEVVAELTDVSGTITGDGISLDADQLTASIGGALDIDLTDVSIDVPPVDGVLLAVERATAVAPGLGDLTVSIQDLQLTLDDAGALGFSASAAEVTQPQGFARSIGLGGIVPVDLTRLRLAFTDVDPNGRVRDLSRFTIEVDGTVDLSEFADLPFEPVVRLGGATITPSTPPEGRNVRFAARVESVDPLVIVPTEVGVIGLGVRGLEVGDLTIDGEINVDGLEEGETPTVSGSATITGGYDAITGSVTATLAGSFTGGVLDLTAAVGFDAAVKNGAAITDLVATLRMRFAFGTDRPFEASLADVTLGSLRVPLADFATVEFGAVTLSFEEGEPLLAVDGTLDDEASGVGIVFGETLEFLDGWGGRAGGFELDRDFTPRFTDDFFATLTIPDGERFGLPDFVPFTVDEIGFQLPTDLAPGDSLVDVIGRARLLVSGGLQGTPTFPITATFDDLIVDLDRLANFDPTEPFSLDAFPITNLDGVAFAIEPEIDLGAARVSGELRFGAVDIVDGDGVTQSVLYARIRGGLSTAVLDAGADLVISEYGPVLLRVTAPLGIALGPTGFMVTSVTGAAAFGDVSLPEVRPGIPEDLITAIIDLPTDANLDEASLARAIGSSVRRGVPTWDEGIALALEGDLTHVASAGLLKGKVTLAVNLSRGVGPKLLGKGEVEVFGIPLDDVVSVDGSVATTGFLIDFADPLAPEITMAFQSPSPGSPLAVVFPDQLSVGAQLRTDGVITGVTAGLQAFVDSLSTGALAAVAESLETDRSSALRRVVLDVDGDGSVSPAEGTRTITALFLEQRITTLLARPDQLAQVIAPLINAISADLSELQLGDLQAALAEFLEIVQTAGSAALRAAGAQFDPSFVFRIRQQPTLLGIPMGEPTNEVEVIIDRTSLGFSFQTSTLESFRDLLDRFQPFSGSSLGFLGTDRVEAGVQVPVPGLLDLILDGGRMPTLDASLPSQKWSISLAGSYSNYGMTGEVTGFITSAGNEAFVDSRVEQRWLSDQTLPPDPDRIQFIEEADYEHLIEFGGVVLDVRLEVPRLVMDPVDTVRDLPPFPDDPLEIGQYFTEFSSTLLATETPLRLTAYLPSPTAFLDGATFEELGTAASVTGVFEGTRQTPGGRPVARLLSIPIGYGLARVTPTGVEVTAQVPQYGFGATFEFGVDERDGVSVPVAGTEVTLDSEELFVVLDELGIPADWRPDMGDGVTATFRAFTPGFDPDSDDVLRRRGGINIGLTGDIAGFVDDAAFDVTVTPSDGPLPFDAVMTASVDQLGPFGGASIDDAFVRVAIVDGVFSATVEGTATIAGATWVVAGNLNRDLTGSLTLTGPRGQLLDVGGFRFVRGGLTINLVRVNGRLVGSVGLGGVVALPSWLVGRLPAPAPDSGLRPGEVGVVGCMGSNDSLELRLGIGSVNLVPDGSARITGTGRAPVVDSRAACALPAGVLDLDNDDARLIVRRVDGVTTVVVDGQVVVNDLPALVVTGSFTNTGTGTIRASFDNAGLNLGGFVLRGGADLSLLGGNSFRLAVDATTSITNLVTEARVTGDITQSGIQQLSIAVTGLNLSPVVVDSATLTLRRIGARAPFGYQLDAGMRVRIPQVQSVGAGGVTSAAIDVTGTVQTTGDFSLRMSATNLRLVGAPVSGTVDFARTGTTMRVAADATFGVLGTNLAIRGNATIRPLGLDGSMTLSTPVPAGQPAQPLRIGGYQIGGTLTVAFSITGTTARANVTLTNGTIVIPGIGTLTATSSLNTDGTGFIQVGTGGGLRLGGASSPFFAVGTYRLERVNNVTRFAAANAGLEYRTAATRLVPAQVVFSATVPLFSIGSDGSIDVQTAAFRIGAANQLRLEVGSARLTADPGTLQLRLRLPQTQLFVPFLADGQLGRPAISTPAFDIDTGNFRFVLFTATNLDLGLMRLNGRIVFERFTPTLFGVPTGPGVFRLSIEDTTSGDPFVDLGRLGRVTLDAFTIASNGDFDVASSTRRIGVASPAFEIRDASMRFRSSGGLVELEVNGGNLRVPSLSDELPLPDLSLRIGTTFIRNITVPSIDLGPFFSATDGRFRLEITRDRARFFLREDVSNNDPTVSAFAGSTSLELRTLNIDTDGVFTGSVNGRLALFGRRIANATFNVDLDNGRLRMTLPSSSPARLDLGFIAVNVSGSARSDGRFSFSGTTSTSGSVVGLSWNGSVTMTVSNSRISGSYSGRVDVFGFGAGQTTGSVNSTGSVSGTLRVGPLSTGFSFDLGAFLGPDTTRPTISSRSNITRTASEPNGTLPVYYNQPTATDSRDGDVTVVCDRPSGSLFTIGQTTTVTCTARDAAGNERERTFTVTVNRP
jgi:hypothetical protein